MLWQKDLARVSLSLSYHKVDDMLLWDAEEDSFDDPSLEFWNEIMPYAHGVKCVPFNYNNFDFPETIATLKNQTVRGFFDAIYKHMHSTIPLTNKDVLKAAIKNLRRIHNKKRRNLKLHLLKHGILTWIEFFEGELIFGGPKALVLNDDLIWICPIERWRDNGN